ncbi:MAG TPA: peptide chain release factor N(5)-glutamine methyltransferase [Gemmatimonadales bacterium]|nr:peptide chain release factor N(5)-glutamine methyltransferase [Gemmatimonadales bacterium]
MPERLNTGVGCSVGDALDAAATTLTRAGVPDPVREARTLWAALADGGVTQGDVWLAREREATPGTVARFREAVARRAAGEPFAYAVGQAEFRTLVLKSDRRALIPRPETEGLVDLVLRALGPAGRDPGTGGGVAADVGTGCGCVALALAVEGPFERVIAVERSPTAAALARENVARVRPRVPVEVREGDWLGPLAGERCRVLVANPPYLTEAEYQRLDPAVRRFEPRAALVSGPDGLDATRALVAQAPSVLAPGGLLALEVDERRAASVCEFARPPEWARVTVHEDVFGRPRYVLALREEVA